MVREFVIRGHEVWKFFYGFDQSDELKNNFYYNSKTGVVLSIKAKTKLYNGERFMDKNIEFPVATLTPVRNHYLAILLHTSDNDMRGNPDIRERINPAFEKLEKLVESVGRELAIS